MDELKKKQIIEALSKRVESFVCPICHQSKYSFVDGYSVDIIQQQYKGLQLGGRIMPKVTLVCNNCGHIDSFSLGVLGLMEDNADDADERIKDS